jgi:hypothetical protein
MVVPRTFLRVNGKHQHQDAQRILAPFHINDVCIRPVEQFLGDTGHRCAAECAHLIIPFPEAALYLPAVAVDDKTRTEEGQFLLDAANVLLTQINFKFGKEGQDPLFHRAHMIPHGIQNMKAVAPGKLSLHAKNHISLFTVNIIAVKPGEKALFKE